MQNLQLLCCCEYWHLDMLYQAIFAHFLPKFYQPIAFNIPSTASCPCSGPIWQQVSKVSVAVARPICRCKVFIFWFWLIIIEAHVWRRSCNVWLSLIPTLLHARLNALANVSPVFRLPTSHYSSIWGPRWKLVSTGQLKSFQNDLVVVVWSDNSTSNLRGAGQVGTANEIAAISRICSCNKFFGRSSNNSDCAEASVLGLMTVRVGLAKFPYSGHISYRDLSLSINDSRIIINSVLRSPVPIKSACLLCSVSSSQASNNALIKVKV